MAKKTTAVKKTAKKVAKPAARKSAASRPAAKAAKKKPAPKTPAVKINLSRIRERLQKDLAKLKSRLGDLLDDGAASDAANVGDIADVASQHEVGMINREIKNTEAEQLKQVQDALRRLDEGTFGQCIRCGCKIEPERLEALPHAPTCISCRRREERGEFAK